MLSILVFGSMLSTLLCVGKQIFLVKVFPDKQKLHAEDNKTHN